MTDEEWAAWEASFEDAEQIRDDVKRIRAFALYCCLTVQRSARSVRRALLAVERAQTDREASVMQARLEAAVSRCKDLCIYAERVSLFAVRCMAGDVAPADRAQAAMALEELFG